MQLFLSFHLYVGSGDQIRVIRLAYQALYSPSHPRPDIFLVYTVCWIYLLGSKCLVEGPVHKKKYVFHWQIPRAMGLHSSRSWENAGARGRRRGCMFQKYPQMLGRLRSLWLPYLKWVRLDLFLEARTQLLEGGMLALEQKYRGLGQQASSGIAQIWGAAAIGKHLSEQIFWEDPPAA